MWPALNGFHLPINHDNQPEMDKKEKVHCSTLTKFNEVPTHME